MSQPRVSGHHNIDFNEVESNDFLREIWGDKAYIASGGFAPQTAAETVSAKGGLIAFGRHYIANVSAHPPIYSRSSPDLCLIPARLAAAHQVRSSADQIPTLHLLHLGGPARLYRLPGCHPLPTDGYSCYRQPEDRGRGQPHYRCSCRLRTYRQSRCEVEYQGTPSIDLRYVYYQVYYNHLAKRIMKDVTANTTIMWYPYSFRSDLTTSTMNQS